MERHVTLRLEPGIFCGPRFLESLSLLTTVCGARNLSGHDSCAIQFRVLECPAVLYGIYATFFKGTVLRNVIMVFLRQFSVSDGMIVATMELIGALHVHFYPGDHNMPRHYV